MYIVQYCNSFDSYIQLSESTKRKYLCELAKDFRNNGPSSEIIENLIIRTVSLSVTVSQWWKLKYFIYYFILHAVQYKCYNYFQPKA